MSWRTYTAILLLLGLLGLAGRNSPQGERVATDTELEAFGDHDSGVACYYRSTSLSSGASVGSLDCVRPETVPESYPDVSDMDRFSVVRNEDAGTVCYQWNDAAATSCLSEAETGTDSQ